MTIYILALHGVATGGPEATHQLSDALLEQGFDARLVYFKWADLRGGVPAAFPDYGGFAPEYARYKVELARSLPDEEGSVIVLPETAAMLAPAFQRAKVLIWWLSVDNAFGALSAINLNYLRRPNVYHASQSRYAQRFCDALQLNHIGMLSDYTVDLTEYADPLPMEQRPKLVAFNARPDKVIADLPVIGEEIAKLDPEIRCIAIHGMSRPEIAAVFAQARVYVDLGNFPGKDRMPREAVSMGCHTLIAPYGASMTGWLQVEPECWYSEHEFAPGVKYSLASLVCTAVQSPENGLAHLLEVSLPQIRAELAIFFSEVATVFSQLEFANEE